MRAIRVFIQMMLLCLAALFMNRCTKSYVKEYNVAVDHYQSHNYSTSLDFFKKAVIAKPEWAEGYYGLGMSFYKLGRSGEAETQFLKALELKPNDTNFLLALGLAYYAQGKKELSAVSFKRSFEIQPTKDNAFNLGLVLRELGRNGEARPHFEWLIHQSPGSAEALENLALCFEAEGNEAEARKVWRQVLPLERDPGKKQTILARLPAEESRVVQRPHAETRTTPVTRTEAKKAFLPPTIVVYSPSTGSQVFDETIQLEAKVLADAGVEDVKILINGQEFRTERGMVVLKESTEKRTHLIDTHIPLNAGENTLKLVAIDRTGQTSEESIILTRIQPRLFGLFAGVSEYADESIPTLEYADEDAIALHDFFKGQTAYAETHLRLLINEDATRANITQALAYFLSRSAPHDLAIIFLAGHGMQEAGEYFFIPYDALQSNLFGTGIKDVEFKSSLRRVGAKRLLLFTDTCHSGGILTSDRGSGAVQRFFENLTEVEGQITITASKFNEVSMEHAKLKHGIFSYYLLEGLKGAADQNSDDIVGVMELYRYISQKIPDVTRGGQHPVILIPGGSLVGDVPVAMVQK